MAKPMGRATLKEVQDITPAGLVIFRHWLDRGLQGGLQGSIDWFAQLPAAEQRRRLREVEAQLADHAARRLVGE